MYTAEQPTSLFDKILAFIDYTNQNIFLTGKAGTGKTTLLRQISEKGSKKMVIVAPTGVAAMNAKGTTINSFFQLPPGSFFPGEISLENLQSGFLSIESTVANLSYSRDKLSLFNELQLLVIDEISMVRCDLLDMIDAILRSVRNNQTAFGGVQLLLIGDLYQLPPVAKREDWAFLSKVYASPYFFDAYVVRRNPVLQIELTKVFRQTEPEFIKILNDIRSNQIQESGLELLNKRYLPDFRGEEGIDPIIITSHNAEANAINKAKLEELPGMGYTFEGEVSGDFRELGLQAEQTLTLKVAAQVMFIKNDAGENRRYFNGKIGRVTSIDNGQIYISFPDEPEPLLLEKSSWQAFEYKSDPQQEIVQQQVGEFSQYPIKLAWAVTIHKSQGLTFDSAIIDAGKSFISGQVYVALSRVRTLDGLILKSRIGTESLRSNPEVVKYMKPAAEAELDAILLNAQENYILQLVLNHFSLNPVIAEIDKISSSPDIVKAQLPEFKNLIAQVKQATIDLSVLAERFKLQVQQLLAKSSFAEQQQLQTRIESALTYFSKEIVSQLINPVNKGIRIKAKTKIQQQTQHMLQKLRQLIENRIAAMQYASTLLKEPILAQDYVAWIEKQKAEQNAKPDASSGNQQATSLQLF
jgi:ATP-dependent DNA helicase PIF1